MQDLLSPLILAQPAAVAAPVNTVPPAVTGTPNVGEVLTTTDGTWDNSPTGFSYQWFRNDDGIGTNPVPVGTDQNTYTTVAGDENKFISCEVTATNAGGSTAAMSNYVEITAAGPPSLLQGLIHQIDFANGVASGQDDNVGNWISQSRTNMGTEAGGAPDGGNCTRTTLGFDDANINYGNRADDFGGGQWTLAIWFWLRTYTNGSDENGAWILNNRNPLNIQLNWNKASNVMRWTSSSDGSSWDVTLDGNTVALNEWNYIAIIQDVANLTMYQGTDTVSPVSTGSQAIVSTLNGASAPLVFCNSAWTPPERRFEMDGFLFSLGVWSEALDNTRLLEHWNNGAGKRFADFS